YKAGMRSLSHDGILNVAEGGVAASVDPDGESCELLIRNAHIVTMDAARRVVAPGAIAIANRRIVCVGADEDLARRFGASRTVDAKGSLVHPGFVDAHYHATMHTTRGAIPDAPAGVHGGSARS